MKRKAIKNWVESLKAQTKTLDLSQKPTYWDLINFRPDLFGIAKILTRIKETELLLNDKEKLELEGMKNDQL